MLQSKRVSSFPPASTSSFPPPSELQLKKPTLYEDKEDNRPHKVRIDQKSNGEYLMTTVTDEEDLEKSIELNKFEYELFEQYKEACLSFRTLCISKLARRKPATYNLMSRIYELFEKYGIDSGHKEEFIIEFTRDDLDMRPRHLIIGNGKFRGVFYYSGWTLKFNLSDKSAYGIKRVKLLNGELTKFEGEFRRVVMYTRASSNSL